MNPFSFFRSKFVPDIPLLASPVGKRCLKCKEVFAQPTEHFSVENRRADKLQNWCKACCRSYRSNRASKSAAVDTLPTKGFEVADGFLIKPQEVDFIQGAVDALVHAKEVKPEKHLQYQVFELTHDFEVLLQRLSNLRSLELKQSEIEAIANLVGEATAHVYYRDSSAAALQPGIAAINKILNLDITDY